MIGTPSALKPQCALPSIHSVGCCSCVRAFLVRAYSFVPVASANTKVENVANIGSAWKKEKIFKTTYLLIDWHFLPDFLPSAQAVWHRSYLTWTVVALD